MTITNKFLSEHSQKNILLNMAHYTDEEIDSLQELGFVTLIQPATTVAYMRHYDERLYVNI